MKSMNPAKSMTIRLSADQAVLLADAASIFVRQTLVLSEIGRTALRWSRLLAGVPQTVTISREAPGWWCAAGSARLVAHG